jgi:putative SOS response-associated peptidase YedK
MINARAGMITEKPAYRAAAVKRRPVTPIPGDNEWVQETLPESSCEQRLRLQRPHFVSYRGCTRYDTNEQRDRRVATGGRG